MKFHWRQKSARSIEDGWKETDRNVWTLTSGTGTAGGGATGEWLWDAGSRSGDRPRPPATPKCQPAAGDRAPAHLLTSASVSQNLIGDKTMCRKGDDVTNLWIQFSNLQSCSLPNEAMWKEKEWVSVLLWSTCLEASSVASCHGELVAPLCVAHVRHESVVQGITWEKHTHNTCWWI